MRKLGLNRRTGGAKAVLPPMIPGSGGGNEPVDPIYSTAQEMMYPGNTDAYPSYPDSVHSGNSGDTYSTASELAQYTHGYYNSTHSNTNNEEGCLDKSYESSLSEGLYSTCNDPSTQEPIYRKVLPRSLRSFHSESAATSGGVMRPSDFKEPFPPVISRSMSTSTPSPSPLGGHYQPSMMGGHPQQTELSPAAGNAPRGSRNSVASSSDSGWASAPLNPSSNGGFHTRASNTSLNSDKTNNSAEDSGNSGHYRMAAAAATAAQKQQRRLSSISSTGSIGMNTTFTYGSQINSRQDPNRQSMRTFGSQESVGSSKSRKQSSVSLCSRNSSNGSLSTCSSSSLFRSTDGVSTLDYAAMIREGVGWEEIINCWLSQLRFSEYYSLFITAGYDLQTVSRMTPEDFTAIGIKKPNHRKKLKLAAEELGIGDGLPDYVPASVHQFMALLRLQEYLPTLAKQGYKTVDDLLTISIEDLEDIGFYRLGHQKRLLLGIKKVKELKKLGQVARPETSSGYHQSGGQQMGYMTAQNSGGGSAVQYYPEQLPYSSLPPMVPHSSGGGGGGGMPQHRFSSFHHETPPLITEGEVWMSRGEGVGNGMVPTPMPSIGANYQHQQAPQRRYERSQSEDHRPSIWQKFKSFEDGDRPAAVRRSTVSGQINGHPAYANNPHNQGHHQPEVRSTGVEARFGMAEQRPFPLPQSGTLPRPQATVKPLPAPSPPNSAAYEDYYPPVPQKPAFSTGYHHNSSTTTTVTQQHGTSVVTAVDVHYGGGRNGGYVQQQDNFQLPEVKKPDFSSLEDEGLNTEGDILLPFANDRGGTIKYKTNPTLAFQQLQNEESTPAEPGSPPPSTPPLSGECLSPEFPAPPSGEELDLAMAGYSHYPTDNNSQTPGPPPPLDTSSPSGPPPPQSPLTNNTTKSPTAAAPAPENGNNTLTRQSSLLYTPTRKPNRTAGDVLQDIGTMLADLTDELDNMLSVK